MKVEKIFVLFSGLHKKELLIYIHRYEQSEMQMTIKMCKNFHLPSEIVAESFSPLSAPQTHTIHIFRCPNRIQRQLIPNVNMGINIFIAQKSCTKQAESANSHLECISS